VLKRRSVEGIRRFDALTLQRFIYLRVMAEVQTNTQSGEMSQRFIEFVMMQAQNAALFLGQIPNPQTGKGEVNLELAKMFIDQLAMIQEKTRGNLTNEETAVLRNTISNLQMAFVEVSRQVKEGGTEPAAPETPESKASEPEASPAAGKPSAPAATDAESESRKKFTKSYGA
jgi:uncharacterized protein DUF1844